MENNDININCAEAAVPIIEAKNDLVDVHRILNIMHKKLVYSNCEKEKKWTSITTSRTYCRNANSEFLSLC